MAVAVCHGGSAPTGTYIAGYGTIGGQTHGFLLTPANAGDANLDGNVDINDLTVVLTGYNQTGVSWGQGDLNGDGTVDINDLTLVLANYGQSSGAGIKAVPEPSAVALLLAGASCLLAVACRRRRVV